MQVRLERSISQENYVERDTLRLKFIFKENCVNLGTCLKITTETLVYV